ncbi:hypothetical protein HDU93_001406, partial [Gonapodya sp. JEL0774]
MASESSFKELKSPLKEFDPRDPIGSLSHYHAFLSDVHNHLTLRKITEDDRCIAAISPNIPATVRSRIASLHSSAILSYADWLKALDVAYFPPDRSLWHRALEKFVWNQNTRFSNHIMDLKHVAHRAGLIDLNDLSTLPNQLK